MTTTLAVNFLFALSLLLFLPTLGAAQEGVPINLAAYRTVVSPASVEMEARILQYLIPMLAAEMYPPGSLSSDVGIQSVNMREDKTLVIDAETGRPRPQVVVGISVMGDIYRLVTDAFLSWRMGYEQRFIASASGEISLLPTTPLAQIASNLSLAPREKARQWLYVLQADQFRKNQPANVPLSEIKDDNRILSEIMEVPSIKARVQFSYCGEVVTVLENDTGQVRVIPYLTSISSGKWLDRFVKEVERQGFDKAEQTARGWYLERGDDNDTVVSPPEPLLPLMKQEKPVKVESEKKSTDNGKKYDLSRFSPTGE
jgi:hypothetical protein